MKETLSDKIQEHGRVGREWYRLNVEDVRGFISDLKDEVFFILSDRDDEACSILLDKIDKLAGPELINHSPQENKEKLDLGVEVNEPCESSNTLGKQISTPEDTRKGLCECGHPGNMHFDGEQLHIGECYEQIGMDPDTDEPIFCECKKFKPKRNYKFEPTQMPCSLKKENPFFEDWDKVHRLAFGKKKGCGKNGCGKRNVRIRHPVGEGSSRKILTGVELYLCPVCSCKKYVPRLRTPLKEEALKKGCGKWFYLAQAGCEVKCGTIHFNYKRLCPACSGDGE